jgi:hypothetical protein
MTDEPEFESAGEALWQSYTSVLDLDPGEKANLRMACHALDELAKIELILSKTQPLVKGSRNQPRLNPLLAAASDHRRVVYKLLGAIKIPANRAAAIESNVGNILSLRAQTAARARWSRRKANG